jgi:glycosyl hydrolase family 26
VDGGTGHAGLGNPWRIRLGSLIACLIAVAGLWLALPGRADATCPRRALGIYRGGLNVNGARAFESWLGRDIGYAMDFLPGTNWSQLEQPTEWVRRWSFSGYRIIFSVPIIPDNGGTLAAGAAGQYDGHFRKIARVLVAHHKAHARLRLGWEFNGDWFRWSAQQHPRQFAAYWRRIVTTMRSVANAHFRFDWSPSAGVAPWVTRNAYPGDRYVNYIGLSSYDQSWIADYRNPVARWKDFLNRPIGLKWQRRFAHTHGKRMTYPEWGLVSRSDGHGGGDDPYFIQHMADWIRNNNVAYASYFEADLGDGRHRMMYGQFPNAGTRFRQLFSHCP